MFNVQNGKIVYGQVFSDCLIPSFIEEINLILDTKEISYDKKGIKELSYRLYNKFIEDKVITEKFIPEIEQWLCNAI